VGSSSDAMSTKTRIYDWHTSVRIWQGMGFVMAKRSGLIGRRSGHAKARGPKYIRTGRQGMTADAYNLTAHIRKVSGQNVWAGCNDAVWNWDIWLHKFSGNRQLLWWYFWSKSDPVGIGEHTYKMNLAPLNRWPVPAWSSRCYWSHSNYHGLS